MLEKRPMRIRCDYNRGQQEINPGDRQTYNRELRNHHAQCCKEVDQEIGRVVMRVVRAEEEENDRHAEEELLGRSVLIAVVDLLPHIEVVICTGVELERNACDVVKHNKGHKHVCNVGERPRCLLRDAGDDVIKDLQCSDQDEMNCPSTYYIVSTMGPGPHEQRDPISTFGIDPVGIQVRQSSLVTHLLIRLGRLLIDDAARSPPPPGRP